VSKKYVIIGTSAAGLSAAATIRSHDASGEIVCFSRELSLPYNKCLLADYVSGELAQDQVYTKSLAWCNQQSISLKLGSDVISIVPDKKSLVLGDQEVICYDSLLVATGASFHTPSLSVQEGVFSLYTLEDAYRIVTYLQSRSVKNALIIGTGLTGLELGDALHSRGITVTFIEKEEHVFPALRNADASRYVQRALLSANVTIHTNTVIKSMKATQKKRFEVVLTTGHALQVDMVIYAGGIIPQSSLALQAGISIVDNAIVTTDHMETSHSGIYAAGDVALVKDRISGIYLRNTRWSDAVAQGMHAGLAMAGKPSKYPGIVAMAKSNFFGINYFQAGTGNEKNSVVHRNESTYTTYLMRDKKIARCLLLGESIEKISKIRNLLIKQELVSEKLL
jgi:NADPH-dependent 2,4-dienoyl-CoA reductase/sulfur reductase-like enzyme